MTHDNLGFPDRCSECDEPVEFCETICPDCRQKLDVMTLLDGEKIRDALIAAFELQGRRRTREIGLHAPHPEHYYWGLIREIERGLYRAWSKPDLCALVPGTRTVFFSIGEDIVYGVMCWPPSSDEPPSLFWFIER